MAQVKLKTLSESDYLAGEQLPGPRHEYVAGEMFAMAGASKTHGTICVNIGFALKGHLRGSPCRSWMADMKVRVGTATAYYYPDVVVSCADADRAPDSPSDYLQAPSLIVEVLSPSTASTDRREKLLNYRQLPSLQEYVLVDQERQWVEVYRRSDDGWLHLMAQAGESVELQSIGLSISVADIYEDTEVPAEWEDTGLPAR
jgi:Uma2 family endonuclease